MSLKWSTSMKSTVHNAESRRARAIARTTAASSARRFASPVSGSVNASVLTCSYRRAWATATAHWSAKNSMACTWARSGISPFTGSSTEMRPRSSPTESTIFTVSMSSGCHSPSCHSRAPTGVFSLSLSSGRITNLRWSRKYERLSSISGCMTSANSARETGISLSCLLSASVSPTVAPTTRASSGIRR